MGKSQVPRGSSSKDKKYRIYSKKLLKKSAESPMKFRKNKKRK